jgi:Tol biopolymer transport system component
MVQRWSPDGTGLLVSGFRRKENVKFRRKTNLYLVNPQTGETELLVDKPETWVILGEWTPDGEGFYYACGDSVMLHKLESGLEQKIYENPDLNGFLALSPSGERLVIGVEDKDNGSSLSIVDVSSGQQEKSIILGRRHSVGEYFDWSPDGRYVYYTKAEGKKSTSLWRIDILGDTPERLWQSDKRLGGPRIHPSGEQIAFDEVTHETSIWLMEGFIPGTTPTD